MTDFDEWAVAPGLDLTLQGRTYTVPALSVQAAKQVLAAAVRGEVALGLAPGPVPDEVQTVLDTITTGTHPALGPVYEQLAADGVPQVIIDRMAYYATFYWSRGKAYADTLARLLWSERTSTEEADAGPKG